MGSKRVNTCRYCLLDKLGATVKDCTYLCTKTEKSTTEEQCISCEQYKSKYIEYPIEVSEIKSNFASCSFDTRNQGKLVKIRVCEEDKDAEITYLGIHLGDMIIDSSISHNEKTKVLTVNAIRNPAIYVPALKRVVYGCESWWALIESKDELSNITDKDIDGQWYVGLLKNLYKGETEK